MLRFHGILRSLITIYQNASKIRGHVFRWDGTKGKIVLAGGKQLRLWFFALTCITSIHLLKVTLQVSNGNIVKYGFSLVNLIGLLCATCYLYYNSFTTTDEISAKFLNGLLELEQGFQKDGQVNNGVPGESSHAKLVCELFVLTDSVIPWLYGIGAGLLPCSQLNLIAILNPACGYKSDAIEVEGKRVFSLLLKVAQFIVFGILNGIISKAILGTGILVCMHILVACVCQKSAMEIYKSSYVKMGMQKVRLYRQLQLLNRYFNEAHIGIIFITMMTCSLVQTCVAYVLTEIAIDGELTVPIPVIVVDLALFLDTALISLYIFGKAGNLFTLSGSMLVKNEDGLSGARARKQRKMFLRSCAPLKVLLGITNFVEKETPLKFLNFSIDRFIDLLLLNSKRHG